MHENYWNFERNSYELAIVTHLLPQQAFLCGQCKSEKIWQVRNLIFGEVGLTIHALDPVLDPAIGNFLSCCQSM